MCIGEPRIHKEQDQEKIKIPSVTDEGWNTQKQLSGPVEQRKKEKKRLQDPYLHPRLSSDLVPHWLFYRIGIGCRKWCSYVCEVYVYTIE